MAQEILGDGKARATSILNAGCKERTTKPSAKRSSQDVAESLVGARIQGSALFSDGILSGPAACRMAGLSKAQFHYLLGERGIAHPLAADDLDLENIAAGRGR